MRTCGMMGEVVGKAASICVLNKCLPRGVYESHWGELDKLMKLPGKARRATVYDEFEIPDDALPLATPYGPVDGKSRKGIDPKDLPGLIIDDIQAKKAGSWTAGTGLAGFVGHNYLYNNGEGSVRFDFAAPANGSHEIRLAYQPHENRGARVPVTVAYGETSKSITVNMQNKPPLKFGFISLGKFELQADEPVSVTLSTENAGGHVHADAIMVLKSE